MTLKRGLLQLLLAALLLAAQHGALTHSYRHWQQGPATAQTEQHDGGHKSSKVRLCDFHCSFAEVLGVAVSSAIFLCVVAQSVEWGTDFLSPPHNARHLVPASRGPPVPV